METLIAISKLFTAFTAILLFFFQHNPPVGLTRPTLKLESGYLTINSELVNGFPKELEELILSGTEITLKFRIILRENNKIVQEKKILHSLVYDIIKKEYIITSSEKSRPFKTKDRAKMKEWMSKLNGIKLISELKFQPQKIYWVEVSCTLAPIEVKALNKKEFDLMRFWNYKTPLSKSKKYLLRK
jgi:hypothetical protein